MFRYDGAALIRRSIALGAPLIFVEMNYRVNGFGFLAGQELQADGSTNLGLRDQRLALECECMQVYHCTLAKPDRGARQHRSFRRGQVKSHHLG